MFKNIFMLTVAYLIIHNSNLSASGLTENAVFLNQQER